MRLRIGVASQSSMNRARLDNGAARGRQPAEPAADVLQARLPGGRGLLAHRDDGGEGSLNGRHVRAGVQCQQAIPVEFDQGSQIAERPTVQQDPGIDGLAPVDARHDPQDRVLERLRLAGHAVAPRSPAPDSAGPGEEPAASHGGRPARRPARSAGTTPDSPALAAAASGGTHAARASSRAASCAT